jgi:hypothetical protein
VCTLVIDPEFSFFGEGSSGFLELLMKLLVIAGGALTMQKSMALVGNLVSSGAGSNELRDNAFSAGRLAGMAGKAVGGVLGNTVGLPAKLGFKAGKSILKDALAMKSRDLGSKLLDKVGLGISGNTSDKDGVKDPGGSGAKNDNKPGYGSNPNSAKDSIKGGGFALSFGGNANNNDPNKKDNNPVNDAIENGGNDKKGENGDNKGTENKQDNGEQK